MEDINGGRPDETEGTRREPIERINAVPIERCLLEIEYGQVWDTTELAGEFEVWGFMAPFVVVRRRCDGKIGSLMFQHSPRYYFCFEEDNR